MQNTIDRECTESNYIGNRLASALDLLGPDDKTLREKYIIGEPRACPAASASEMKRRGFVGIYQREQVVRFRLPNSNLVFQKCW